MSAPQPAARVRHATIDDLPAVCALAELLAEQHHAAAPEVFLPAGDPARDEAHWRESLVGEGRQGFVIDGPQGLEGFVTAMLVQDQGSLVRSMLAGRVNSLCVAPHARRRGHAHALMQAAEDWLRSYGAEELRLVVWDFNQEAMALYRGLGWAMRSHTMVRRFDEETPR